jgi:hypothetical protein
MNKYLGITERDMYIKAGAIETLFIAMDEAYTKVKNVDKELLKCVRTCKTLTDKILRIRMRYLDKDEIDKLIEQVKRHQVVVRPTDIALREQKEIDKLNQKTVVETDDFINIASWTIENTCKKCTNCGDEVTDCELKKLFIKYDLAVLGADATENCPYQYKADFDDHELGDLGLELVKARIGA